MKNLAAAYYRTTRQPLLAFRKTLNTFLPRLDPSFLRYGRGVFEKDISIWRDLPLDHCKSAYDNLGGNKGILLQKICDVIKPNESVLELGCNTGAMLFALAGKGYSCLYGVEINAGAVAFARYRAEAEKIPMKFFNQDFPGFFRKYADQRFDWVITYGATLELLHPSFDIFAALGKVTAKGVMLCLNPDTQKFPRWYGLLIRRHFPLAPQGTRASLLGGMQISEGHKKSVKNNAGE